MKKVSVIIPFYNNEKYVETAINNVISQTYGNIELICIDDGSSDNTGIFLKKFQMKLKNIEYKFFLQENKGASAARNKGLEHATGEYIFFLDSDDKIESTLLEDNIKLLEEENSDLVIFGHQTFDSENNIPNKYPNVSKVSNYPCEQLVIEYDNLFTEEVISFFIWNKLYKRSIIEENHIRFNNNQIFGEDALFNFEYYQCMTNITFNPKIYYSYMRRADSISGNQKMNRERFKDEINVIYGLNKVLKEDYTLSVRRLVRLIMRLKHNDNRKLTQYYQDFNTLLSYEAPRLSIKDSLKKIYIKIAMKLSIL